MLHKNISAADNHVGYTWAVADSTARNALSVVAADVGKVCWQQDTDVLYILKDDSPMTWVAIGAPPAIADITDWPSTVSATEVGYLDGVTSSIQTQLGNKSDTSHNHSGTYEPVLTAASQVEMEAGTEAGLRSMSPLRVAQAIAALAAGGGGSLDDLTDVTITTPSNGQVLKYNGSAWVNGADATGGTGGESTFASRFMLMGA